MKTITYETKFLWLFRCSHTVEKPRIRHCSPPRKMNSRYKRMPGMWSCEGAGQFGYGHTPQDAWNDWANWALI